MYIDRKRQGRVTVTEDGLYTVVSAAAPGVRETVPLFVCGEGRSVYLGKLIPDGDCARLERRLTRSQQNAFPESITSVSDRKPQERRPREESAAAVPPSAPRGWVTHPDGTLTGYIEGSSVIAIPAQLRARRPGIRTETVDGREYLIFRY